MTVIAKKTFVNTIIITLIVSQLVFSFSFLAVPKKAEAVTLFGVTFNVTMGDIPRYVERIVQGAMMRVAQNYANQYLQRFVSKLQDKFRIRDFLYEKPWI
jgi:hypothetical protein